MKKSVITFVFFLVILCCSCNNSVKEIDRISFSISKIDRKIVVPIQLYDSLTVKMVFDTGTRLGTFILDSTYCINHPEIVQNIDVEHIVPAGSSWSPKRFMASIYITSPLIHVGTKSLCYDYIKVYDRKGYFNNTTEEGLFNIPKDDSTHIWELNFEHNYIEVHDSERFDIPNECYIAPMFLDTIRNNPFNIQIPFNVTCINGDTITINRKFLIDSAMPWDLALMRNAKEFEFFDSRETAEWIGFSSSYFKYNIVEGSVFNELNLDSLRIYTFHHSNTVPSDYMIGLNFLKRFNVFFDMKNMRIGFQPIENFQRVINPLSRRFHISTIQMDNGKIIVNQIADYRENCYKSAGFRSGDEILKVNGKYFKNISQEEKQNLQEQDSLVYEIVRDEVPLTIVVYQNKIEKLKD